MSENISIAVQKLYSCVSKGLGTALIPKDVRDILGRQVAQIEALNDKKEIIDEISGLSYYEQLSVKETQELYERTCSRLLHQEMKKQENIENIINSAKDILEKEQEDSISSKDVNEDWLMRFFNSVQDISDEKMQLLWGKILAGEIKQPSSFSLRSLDAMTKMSKDEAQLFEELSSYVINFRGTYAILNNDDLNKKYSISYGQILALEECGIIDSSTTMSLSLGVDEKTALEIVYDLQLLIASAKDERKIKIQIFKLTRIGREIFKIIGYRYNREYFGEVAKILATKNRELVFSIHKILNKLEDGRVEYSAQGTEVIPEYSPASKPLFLCGGIHPSKTAESPMLRTIIL